MSARRKWKLAGVILAGLIVTGIFILQYATRGGFAPSLPEGDAGGAAISEGPEGHKVAGRIYVEGAALADAPLVIVLHGDAPFRKPGYHYAFADELSKRLPGVRVIGLLRPGFEDPYGGRSDGQRGNASGDDYTVEAAIDMAGAIVLLQHKLQASSVVLVGHSGGAAVAANIAAGVHGVIDSLVLVSCPCDVPAFRAHMARLQFNPMWIWPTRSQSPLETVTDMMKPTRVVAITGSEDPITLPAYAQAYAEAATRHGLNATATVLEDRGHEILNDPAVLDLVGQRVTELMRLDGGDATG